MIIKNIKISNFRSYYGLTNIDFKINSEKNITLISGKNGFGKTSFLTALIWGFYGKLMGKVEDKYKTLSIEHENLQQKLNELNSKKLSEKRKEVEFKEKIDELNQETDSLLEEIDKWQI